jgi:hypothetical protein
LPFELIVISREYVTLVVGFENDSDLVDDVVVADAVDIV